MKSGGLKFPRYLWHFAAKFLFFIFGRFVDKHFLTRQSTVSTLCSQQIKKKEKEKEKETAGQKILTFENGRLWIRFFLSKLN